MGDGWKLILDGLNVVGAVGSLASLWVFTRVREIRKNLTVRAALPDLRDRINAANHNLTNAVRRKGNHSNFVAELRGLADDLLVNSSGHEKLHEATVVLVAALKPNDKDTDRLVELGAKVTTVVSLIESAERDLKTWSLSK